MITVELRKRSGKSGSIVAKAVARGATAARLRRSLRRERFRAA